MDATRTPLRVLTVGAHPADIFDQSSGTIAHHRARGDWVGCRAPHPDRLPEGTRADHVLGYFIATELPRPMPGLIVATLLATVLMTVGFVVNSIATVIYTDRIVHMGWAEPGARRGALLCKGLSVGAGLASDGVALLLVLGGQGIRSSVLEVGAILGGVGDVLLAAFLLGVLVPFVSGGPMLLGCLAGAAVGLIVHYGVETDQRISFAWLGLPALAVALVVPLALSVVWRSSKDLTGLTVWTMQGAGEKRHRSVASAPAETAPALTVN